LRHFPGTISKPTMPPRGWLRKHKMISLVPKLHLGTKEN
jgi:hypothetical protein